MDNSGAKAALKGYRLQTLYTLVEILESSDVNNIFQPEGEEDLAVHNNNQITRVIQIKARAEKLSLSSFSPDKKDSFFHRIAKLLNTHQQLIAKVVSFGQIGNEITKAWIDKDINSKKSVSSKLKTHGIEQKSIDIIFEKVKWIIVSEQALENRLQAHLEKTITAGHSETAISLLMAWLYHSAEHKLNISQQDLINKIYAVGKYVAQREAHHNEWFKSIQPLINQKNHSEQYEKLAKEFYQGISTRFSHIQAGLDILRTEQINKIDHAFNNGQQTVIIHGASGQGKTTLAYRYLHDFIPQDWRFQINFIENKAHAETIAFAIADHLSVFKANLYLYIDVSPRDVDWTALIKALLEKSNIKILVSIREEDLARATASDVELGFPVSIPLQFNKAEAKIIYQNLFDKKVTNSFLSFTEAWAKFGGNGALLEYIYFLTQTTSLKERLHFQVKRLREETRQKKLEPAALQLLFCCAVATAYEARIKTAEIVNALNLLEPISTFELFEQEYLIRYSSEYIEPLHPLRSKLLVEILNDAALNPWIKAVTTVLPCIIETDLESFLLYAFVEHPQDYKAIYQKLSELTLYSWRGYAGISRALIWQGIYQYVITNMPVIEQARLIAGNAGWKFYLKPDIANVSEEDPTKAMMEFFGKNNPEKLQENLRLRNQVSSPDSVYFYLKNWLTDKSLNIAEPNNENDWLAFSETLFWLSWLTISSNYNAKWLLEKDSINQITTIDCLAELTFALYYYDIEVYQAFMRKNKTKIEQMFQTQTNTLWIEYKPDNPIAHYIVTFNDDLNKQTVYRATILRKLFPDAQKFGAKGYGHHTPMIKLAYDKANKTGILKEYLTIEQLVHINFTYANLADYNYRPTDWQEYANAILETRKKIVEGLSCLNIALIAYFKNNKSESIIGWKIDSDYWEQLSRINMLSVQFPKSAVDPWGYTSENTKSSLKEEQDNNQIKEKSKQPTPINASVMLAHYKDYQKSWDRYLNSVITFIIQSDFFLKTNSIIGRSPKSDHEYYFEYWSKLGHPYSSDAVHLTVINFNNAKCELKNFQSEFSDKFKELVDIAVLKKLEQQEINKFEKAWHLWYQFAHHPEQHWKDSPDVHAAAITRKTLINLLNAIKKSFAKNTNKTWQARVLSEAYDFEKQLALWIALELDSALALDTAYRELVDTLSHAIRPVEYKELLTNTWQKIIIVPMVQGKTLNNIAWQLLAGLFAGDEPILTEEKSWLFIPQPLPEEIISHFKFEAIKNDNFETISLLSKELAELYITVAHFSNFIEVLPNLNDTGKQILETHLASFYEKSATNISTANKLITDLRNCIKTDAFDKLEVLQFCEIALYPYGKPETDKLITELSDCEQWALSIQQALARLEFINFSY